MPAIKSPSAIGDKWSRVAATRAPDYESGVKSPRRDWADSTLAATGNWKSAVQDAIARGAWEGGVGRAGSATWQKGAVTKGVQRWAPGIAASKDNYVRGFAPYADVIANTSLPARGPKGDPANIERVRIMANALHQTKLSLQGA